jgi:hypothetical protein
MTGLLVPALAAFASGRRARRSRARTNTHTPSIEALRANDGLARRLK